jgi:hypothetical protein
MELFLSKSLGLNRRLKKTEYEEGKDMYIMVNVFLKTMILMRRKFSSYSIPQQEKALLKSVPNQMKFIHILFGMASWG